jgi:hypothetical protein
MSAHSSVSGGAASPPSSQDAGARRSLGVASVRPGCLTPSRRTGPRPMGGRCSREGRNLPPRPRARRPGTTDLACIPSATGFFVSPPPCGTTPADVGEDARDRRRAAAALSGEIGALLAFTAQYFDRPGDPATGERLFASKRCVGCHAVGGVGGQQGPALDP